jgi:hypothetical protein
MSSRIALPTNFGSFGPRAEPQASSDATDREMVMRTLTFGSVVLPLLLLMSAMAAAQPTPPRWECHANRQGESSCRAIWDSRDWPQPPLIQGAPQQ